MKIIAVPSRLVPPDRRRRSHVSAKIPALVVLFSIALFLLPDASTLLQFDRSALARGQLWRLVTCHFVHFNGSHLLWDTAAFALLALLLPRLSRRSWSTLLGSAAASIGVGVWLLQPQFEFYRGLSGIDCALFGALVMLRLRDARRERDRASLAIALLAAIGFAAKCVFELSTQSTAFVTGGDFVPAPLAHLLGAASGAIFASKTRQLAQRVHASEGSA